MMKEREVYGLVLAGGKSTRMGRDKGSIVYHDIPQRDYLYGLLTSLCKKTFYSIREDQQEEFKSDDHLIVDENIFRGPLNGILSAHRKFPDVAWLVLACDLPFIDLAMLNKLLEERNQNCHATAFSVSQSGLPEPLAAIWEPEGLKGAIGYLDNGSSSCPRKYLINSNVKLVVPEKDLGLLNANSEEDYKEALSKLVPR
ncbi:NTP transferase domain-containing protein [Muriicola sp. Z0-33]|uniref:NTP transferase domain-containing protein n=1 Tax=Muriicola sp. Z0-33 TaxID=2816957 RepID=UPI002AA2AE71|nr:NTP transferase domain-containing protein [Muriicola sp. Z0-33]